MEPPRIRDIPSLKQTLDSVQSLEQFKRAFPLMKPFLRGLGVKVNDLDTVFANLGSMSSSAQELAELPDRFNDLFASHGWIMYDAMNVDVAQSAVAKAESGDLDGAELELVNYYDEQTVRRKIMMMHTVAAFRSRIPLAQKALTDYVEGRYHACVPVTLALLDGMVNELGPRGFFAEGVNLEAWDSIAAHSTGLAALAKLLGKTRRKSTIDPITVPYRHGILHGIDLGYDNHMVAAKAWAALFAARDWALKAEQGQLTEPPPMPKSTWRDLLHQIREIADDKARLENWAPRTIRLGETIPISGAPDEYPEDTPEQRLVEFLVCWRSRNFGHMARCLSSNLRLQGQGLNQVAGQLRTRFECKHLKTFNLLELHDAAPAITVITTELLIKELGSEHEQIVKFRLLYEDGEGQPAVRGKPGGEWKIIGYPV